MRILFLATDAYGARGGIALYNRDVLAAWAADPRVKEIVLLTRNIVDPPGVIPPKVTHVQRAAKGKVAYARAFSRALRQERFDVVACGHINLLPLSWMAARVHRAPAVLFIYGIEAWKKPRGAFRRGALRAISKVVSISEFTLQRFRAWAAIDAPAFILPNAIHLEWYAPGPKRPDLERRYHLEGKRVLMTMGRLEGEERYKGFDEVLELLPELVTERPDLVYLICGEGNDRARLEAKARELGVDGHVVFTGYVREEEKVDHYSLADLYVMPSHGEGFGFVFLEALACGIPVIASNADGSREAVRNGELGAIVDPFDRQALKAAILQRLDRPRIVPEGLAYFSFENFERRCRTILDDLTRSA